MQIYSGQSGCSGGSRPELFKQQKCLWMGVFRSLETVPAAVWRKWGWDSGPEAEKVITSSKSRGSRGMRAPVMEGMMAHLIAVLLSLLWMPICLTKCLHGEDMGKHRLPGCGEQLWKIHHLTDFRPQGREVAPLLLFCRESPVAPSVRDELGRLSMWNTDEPRACRSVCSRKCCNIFTAALGDPFSSDLVESTFPPLIIRMQRAHFLVRWNISWGPDLPPFIGVCLPPSRGAFSLFAFSKFCPSFKIQFTH